MDRCSAMWLVPCPPPTGTLGAEETPRPRWPKAHAFLLPGKGDSQGKTKRRQAQEERGYRNPEVGGAWKIMTPSALLGGGTGALGIG